jgi:hypothetical protein
MALTPVAETIDMDYLSRRVAEEGGNTVDLGEREPD